MSEPRVAVIGAGSWGTALADLLSRKGLPTILWSFETDVAACIRDEHRNPRYLDTIQLHPALDATSDIEEAVTGAEVILSVSPSHVVRQVMTQIAPFVSPEAMVVSASKGIEVDTLQTMDEVLAEVLPEGPGRRTAFLSGPSFAMEVAQGHPTAVTMASYDPEIAARAQELFQTDRFRVYTNEDVRGVELGGALKNVIAIASGVVDGLGFGNNTRAALITRGLAEMTRLGVQLGAHPRTFSGLAGMGDLILTCTGALSRNRSVGLELAAGRSLDQIMGDMTMVAEGVRTARSTKRLAARHEVEMPIVDAVHAVLYEGQSARDAVEGLMLREPKPEVWS
jgi:glycerol-3-phosphate dehydrogenase (NAD(P)+)